jgi:hypothetical protein
MTVDTELILFGVETGIEKEYKRDVNRAVRNHTDNWRIYMPRIMAKCLLSLVFVASLALATWEAARAWSYDGKWLSNITWMEITIDNAELWHTGSGIPPSNRYDLQSTMTHEFGHALGLLHTGYPYCPNNTSDATMCPTQGLGAYHYRTLEGDDRNGVNSLYP